MGLETALHDFQLRQFDNLPVPLMKTCVVDGTTGATSLSYCATFRTINGETTASAEAGVANAYGTLDAFHRVKVWVETPPAGARYVRFYKKDGDVFKLLSEVPVPSGNADAIAVWDQGQALTDVQPPTEDTSGRPGYFLLLPCDGKDFQRAEMSDLQAMFVAMIKNVADLINKAGDIVSGCGMRPLGNNRWSGGGGDSRIYAGGGFYIPIPEGEVQLTGVGHEKVGVRISPRVVTDTEDPVLRNVDENVAFQYRSPGAYRLAVTVQWVVDDPTAVLIQDFLNGQLITKEITPERTEIKRMIAQMINDALGTFGVTNFQCSKLTHPTDDTKLQIRVGTGGVAYPQGWRTELAAPQLIPIPKAREYASVNASVAGSFVNLGGSVTGSNAETFNVNGKAIKLRVTENGNSHTVTFTGDGKTALEVCAAISASVNAYQSPESPNLVNCTPVSGKVKIAARNGADLIIEAVANDAYTILGIATGTYHVTGTRLYAINDNYVKTVTDLAYGTEVVESVTHDGTINKDLLAHTNVYEILGASLSQADCWDGKYDYHNGVSFGRSGNFIDFTLYGGADPVNGQTIWVRFRYSRNAVRGTRTLVEAIDVPIVKGPANGTDNLAYTGADIIRRVRNGATVTGLSGAIVDAVEILRVNDTPGQSTTQYNSYALKKNSTATAHSTSQIDWASAGEQGVPPDGQPAVGSTYYVSLRAWWHEIEGDAVVAQSYDMYEEIEALPNSNLAAGFLRDYIDFRTAGVLPVHDALINLDYEYYLSRKDRLIVDWTGIVQHIQGEPAYDPPIPAEQVGAYSVAVITLKPYTYSLDDVDIISTGQLRKTMAGILRMDNVIQDLAYAVASNRINQNTATDAAAVESKGIFADPISDQSRCDVAFSKNGVIFDAAIDAQERCVRLPIANTDVRIMEVDEDNSYGVRRVGNTITLDYEEKIFLDQPKASRAINLNPDNLFSFENGTLTLDPEIDVFMDTEQLPQLSVNASSGLQALAGAVNPVLANSITWGSWHLASSSTNFDWTIGTRADTYNRQGTSQSLVVGQETVDLGNRVVDITAVPMMRQIEVTVKAMALYPGIDHALTFEGVAVDLTAVSPSVQGASTYQGKTTVKSDTHGTLTARFVIPSGVPLGTAHVKIFAAIGLVQSSAMGTFYSQGWRQETQGTTLGFDSVTTRTTTQTQSQTVLTYVDPVAQTFLVTSGPKYLSKVRVRFKTKSQTVPVTCEMRCTLNGYPNRVVTLTKTLLPSDVTVSDDASAVTDFLFPNVVGFQPEEYAVTFLTNCDEYEIWVAKLGEIDVRTGELIASQPAGGSLFHSPNASTWIAMPDHDLCFTIYESNFQNNLQIVFKEMTGFEAAQFILRVSEVLAAPCNVAWSYSLNSGASWIPIKAGTDVFLSEITEKLQILLDVTNLGGSYQIIEKWAGILLQLCAESGNYISYNQKFTDELNLPDSVVLYANLAVDGTNGNGVRSATPYFSVDDGETWVELRPDPAFTPVDIGDGSYKEYKFITPGQQTVEGASNTTPIVIASSNHGFQNNAIVDIVDIGGNTAANGTWRCAAVTADTITLIDPETGADSVGNGAYTSGGTITLATFTQCRTRNLLTTTNAARTPKQGDWRGFCI